MNICSLLRCHAHSRADKTALRQGEVSISYAVLWQRVESCAAYLQGQGVRPGDRVALALADHALHLILHYALPRLGAVILPVDHRWSGREKAAALRAFCARFMVVDVQEDGLPDDRPGDGHNVRQLKADDRWYAADASALPALDDITVDTLLISLSSGTTGRPKGALVSHRQMYERFISQWVSIGFNAQDRFVAATPLFFGAGRSFAMSLLAAGATVLLFPLPYQTETLVRHINDRRASAVFLVPTLLRRLLSLTATLMDKHLLLPHVKILLASGAALFAEEAARIRQQISPGLVAYYASSEGGGISVLHSSEFSEYGHTVGRPSFRTEVQIIDQHDTPVAAGETGRLRYRGPGVATRFIDSAGTETASDSAGWFLPGDLACRLDSGHIILLGRDKDLIIRSGVNIYPAEVEATLMRHEAVAEAAVIGEEAASTGESVVAFIVITDAANNKAKDEAITAMLSNYCKAEMAPYKTPSRFILTDTLPRKHSGKVDKPALRAQLAATNANDAASAEDTDNGKTG